MRFFSQSVQSPALLHHGRWNTAVVGDAVDERGRAAIAFASDNADRLLPMRFHPATLDVEVDGDVLSPDGLDATVVGNDGGAVLVEATTLGLVEIFLLCKAMKDSGRSDVSLLYTEPTAYRIPARGGVLRRRDFELSDEVGNFSGVPGAAVMLRGADTRVVFLVGYEGQRLEQALEQINVRPSQCSIVFGVPAFQPGWEMDAFANNVRILREQGIDEIMFAGAHSPAGAFDTLRRAFDSRDEGERLLISPIGTKPHGIGAVLFACEVDEVGILYDHPIRSRGRSNSVATWHLYNVTFS